MNGARTVRLTSDSREYCKWLCNQRWTAAAKRAGSDTAIERMYGPVRVARPVLHVSDARSSTLRTNQHVVASSLDHVTGQPHGSSLKVCRGNVLSDGSRSWLASRAVTLQMQAT